MLRFWRLFGKNSTHSLREGGAFRIWKSGHSSAHPWYLAVTCLTSASSERLRKIGLVWEMTSRPSFYVPFVPGSHFRCLFRSRRSGFLVGVGDDYRKILCIQRSWLYTRGLYRISHFFCMKMDSGSCCSRQNIWTLFHSQCLASVCGGSWKISHI